MHRASTNPLEAKVLQMNHPEQIETRRWLIAAGVW
jgi:hypothetical protein